MLEDKGETTNLSGDSTIAGLTPGTLFRWIRIEFAPGKGRRRLNNPGLLRIPPCAGAANCFVLGNRAFEHSGPIYCGQIGTFSISEYRAKSARKRREGICSE